MNDEIKETLQRLEELRNSNYIFSTFDVGLLLDYITNLQQENERNEMKKKVNYYKIGALILMLVEIGIALFTDKALVKQT